MNKTNGKIAEQSKEKIADALLCVLEKYSFKDITITQISQEAGLSRKTFYRLFKDKDEVLFYIFEKLYKECLGSIKSKNVHSYWDIVQCYFDFWEAHKKLLCFFSRNGLLPILFEGAYKYSVDIFFQMRSQEIIREYSVPLPYLLAYSIGGIHSMLLKWVENDMEIPSCELIDRLKSAFKSSEV